MLLRAFVVLVGPIFVISGMIMLRVPPKEINTTYGYRTARSMRSPEAWRFAQGYSARLMIRLGALYGMVGVLFTLMVPFGPVWVVLVTLALALVCAILFVATERALQRLGDEAGD